MIVKKDKLCSTFVRFFSKLPQFHIFKTMKHERKKIPISMCSSKGGQPPCFAWTEKFLGHKTWNTKTKTVGHPESPLWCTVFFAYNCCCSVAKLCPTLCSPMDCSLPVSSFHRISQARRLEWVAISFSRGSSWPRDPTHVSCIGRQIVYH